MVNVLLKKQLFEIFRSYFYDAKKNRPRSRVSTILFFVLYAVLMTGFVGGMFVLLVVLPLLFVWLSAEFGLLMLSLIHI